MAQLCRSATPTAPRRSSKFDGPLDELDELLRACAGGCRAMLP
ncbi:MAG: hypothetical protein ACLSVD_04735 [Eggerthellaceae bacterium]